MAGACDHCECPDQGRLDQAEQMYERALAGKEKAFGPDHGSTLGTVRNLGNLYRAQGKLDKAEQIFHRPLTGREKALGREHRVLKAECTAIALAPAPAAVGTGAGTAAS